MCGDPFTQRAELAEEFGFLLERAFDEARRWGEAFDRLGADLRRSASRLDEWVATYRTPPPLSDVPATGPIFEPDRTARLLTERSFT